MTNKSILQLIHKAKSKNWEELDLSGLGITEFPSELVLLTNLRKLNLGLNLNAGWKNVRFNHINRIPKEISNLTKLTHLNLSCNELTTLPSEIGELIDLEELDVSGNRLTVLPKSIGNLINLNNFNAGEVTRITYGDDDFMDWPIHYRNNIKELPFEFAELTNLKVLDLTGNNLPIPPEILEKKNEPEKILNYYFSLNQPVSIVESVVEKLSDVDQEKIIQDVINKELLKHVSRPLNELKLLFVGQGEVGKSSLVERIINNRFKLNQSKTAGISIKEWKIRRRGNHKSDLTYQCNIWDFGGQEIMHATHQFFLTKRSLYIVVLDSRLTQEENRVEYWLKIVQSFGGDSPVLIVGNKIDQHPLDIDRTGLQKKYPNIVGILETSAATGAGIEELKTAITEQVNNLPHIRDLLPETWFSIKTKLEGLGQEQSFINHDQYLELCAENGVSDETSQRTLIGFLHDLGVVLHFQDDPRLESLGILNPQWVTNGVYKILNSHVLFQNKGVLTLKMLNEILNLPEYPASKRLFIVDMMRKFELCYDIEPDKIFLVPDLLPKDEPQLEFSGIPAFEYSYPVLPSSIITRFIVRMNLKIDDGIVWRTGVLLKLGDNHALIKADLEDRKITIAVDGLKHNRRDALSAIRFQLDEIHASIKGLNPEKRVPVPGAPNAESLDYEYLLMLEQAGDETCRVKDGNRLVTVNVRQVLSAIEHETERKDRGGNMTKINIGNITIGDGAKVGDIILASEIQESVRKAEAANIPSEIMETLKLLGEALDVMNKVLPKEKAVETTGYFDKLVDEATKTKPNERWYSVSIEGLIKAAENLDKLGEPVINLSRKILSLLTGGVIN